MNVVAPSFGSSSSHKETEEVDPETSFVAGQLNAEISAQMNVMLRKLRADQGVTPDPSAFVFMDERTEAAIADRGYLAEDKILVMFENSKRELVGVMARVVSVSKGTAIISFGKVVRDDYKNTGEMRHRIL